MLLLNAKSKKKSGTTKSSIIPFYYRQSTVYGMHAYPSQWNYTFHSTVKGGLNCSIKASIKCNEEKVKPITILQCFSSPILMESFPCNMFIQIYKIYFIYLSLIQTWYYRLHTFAYVAKRKIFPTSTLQCAGGYIFGKLHFYLTAPLFSIPFSTSRNIALNNSI